MSRQSSKQSVPACAKIVSAKACAAFRVCLRVIVVDSCCLLSAAIFAAVAAEPFASRAPLDLGAKCLRALPVAQSQPSGCCTLALKCVQPVTRLHSAWEDLYPWLVRVTFHILRAAAFVESKV